jgi:hypothetical protein
MGQTAKIERSFLDGSNRTVLVNSGISLPRAIAIDFESHDVYWIDSVIDSIQVVKTNLVVEKWLKHPRYIVKDHKVSRSYPFLGSVRNCLAS